MMFVSEPSRRRIRQSSGRVVAIIPARLGATRLPNKPLLHLEGEPLIWHVYRGVRACDVIDDVIVASADGEILDEVHRRGGRGVLVTSACDSGTERVAQVAESVDAAYVINVQSDEPFVGPDLLGPVVEALRAGAVIATLSAPIDSAELHDPDVVKVVANQTGRALYFSRAPIPGHRHIGIYGFDRDTLLSVARLPRSPAARAEDLEQLTWLDANYPIAVMPTPRSPISIDTADDLARARRFLDPIAPAARPTQPSVGTTERPQPHMTTSQIARPAP